MKVKLKNRKKLGFLVIYFVAIIQLLYEKHTFNKNNNIFENLKIFHFLFIIKVYII